MDAVGRGGIGLEADQPVSPAPDGRPDSGTGSDGIAPTVPFETFTGLDLRVGRIVDVEAFPEARRPAWKLTVDFGPSVGRLRTSAQITSYRPDELVGRQVVGVLNIGVRRIAGFESHFLVLGGLHGDGEVSLLAPDRDLPPGAPVA